MTVEDLLGRRGLVLDCPVINGGFCDHSDNFFVDPFPEHDVLVIDMGFNLLLGLDVEDLEGTRSWTSS